MRRSRFIEEQIIGVLREQEAGSAKADVCRKRGISPATFYQWKIKFGGLEVSEARRLRTREAENARVKRLLAEAMLNKRCSKTWLERMVTPAARREAVAHLREYQAVSERRACRVLGADRTAIRYRSVRPDVNATRAHLRALVGKRRRFGYRRLGLLLSRECVVLNHKKLRRLYPEERLRVHRRGGRKRALGTRAPIAVPDGPNQRWSLDFVSNSLSDGRRIRVLCVVDDCTRECPAWWRKRRCRDCEWRASWTRSWRCAGCR